MRQGYELLEGTKKGRLVLRLNADLSGKLDRSQWTTASWADGRRCIDIMGFPRLFRETCGLVEDVMHGEG
jgi:hypothetical protein